MIDLTDDAQPATARVVFVLMALRDAWGDARVVQIYGHEEPAIHALVHQYEQSLRTLDLPDEQVHVERYAGAQEFNERWVDGFVVTQREDVEEPEGFSVYLERWEVVQ